MLWSILKYFVIQVFFNDKIIVVIPDIFVRLFVLLFSASDVFVQHQKKLTKVLFYEFVESVGNLVDTFYILRLNESDTRIKILGTS